jgi:hypothetical protein
MTITRTQFVDPFLRGGSAPLAGLPDNAVVTALRAKLSNAINSAAAAQVAWNIIDDFDDDGFRNSVKGGLAEQTAQALMDEAAQSTTAPATGVGPGGIPDTVAGCAAALLASPNVSYWPDLSTGPELPTIQDLAAGKLAFVPHTGQHVKPKLNLMQALVAMAQKGPVMIDALTGGTHTPNSNHYRGTAVDISIKVGNTQQIVATAERFGGRRNSETSHIHLDF